MAADGGAPRRSGRPGGALIAYLHQAGARGAVEQYLQQLLARLEEDSVVIAPEGPNEVPIAGRAVLRAYDDTVGARRILRHVVRELRALGPRLVHVVDAWPLGFIAARLARVPRLLVTHHTPALPRSENAVGRLIWAAGWLARPEVIYTSEADRRRDRRGGVVIPLGIDVERFVPAASRPAGQVVGTVARLVAQKGIDVLVDAAPAVLARHPGARFVVVGDGPLRGELEAAASGLPFEFRGDRADVPEQLRSFDVFALPTRFEGLCIAVLEAQAAGVPVVATPVGGIVETVLPGATGTLVPVDDPAALADAICAVLDDPARFAATAAEARRRVEERYSIDRMVEATFALYRR